VAAELAPVPKPALERDLLSPSKSSSLGAQGRTQSRRVMAEVVVPVDGADDVADGEEEVGKLGDRRDAGGGGGGSHREVVV
jgi:hypothetical protein